MPVCVCMCMRVGEKMINVIDKKNYVVCEKVIESIKKGQKENEHY